MYCMYVCMQLLYLFYRIPVYLLVDIAMGFVKDKEGS